jgi:5-hydroxyisourate hydrolase-like protein (transthyretin family)
VFFTTEARLVGQDTDELSDLYDARVDGGFPAPKVTGCVGEGCQGAPPTPLASVSPGSLSPSGAGNLTPPPAPPAKPTVEILKIKVTATTLLVTVRTSAQGRVQISGKGLTTTIKQGLKAGTHQIKVKLTKAGRKAGVHRKKTRLRVSLTVGKQTVAKTTSVKL